MTPRGLALLLASTVVVALGATQSLLFPLGLAAVVVAAVTIVVDGRRAPGPGSVQVVRQSDRLLSLGVANQVTLRVQAPAGARLRVRDAVPAGIPASVDQFHLRGSGTLAYTLTPQVRGAGDFGMVSMRAQGPWGLGTRDFAAGEPTGVRVDPNISAIRVYEALARRGQLEELGMRTLRRHGEGTEFERVRDAVPDDPLRAINWRATARTGRLMATDLAPERDQPVIACLDHGRLMGVGAGALTKLDHAVNAALLLLHVALRTGDRAGLLTFADVVGTVVPARSGRAQLATLLDALGPVRAGEIESDYTALTALRLSQRRRALVAVFTDVVDPDQVSALVRQCALLRRRHLPLVITVRDPALEDLSTRTPRSSDDAYARAIAGGIITERQSALRLLRASGVDVIDADARHLSPRLVNRYLELKRRAAI